MVKDLLDSMDKMSNVDRIFVSELKTKHFIMNCHYSISFVISNEKDKPMLEGYHK